MTNAPYTPAQLRKWKVICRSDPERVLRVFHIGPPPAKSQDGDTEGEIFAIIEVLQEIAIGQGVPGEPDPAWKDLVEAGIAEVLCDSVRKLFVTVRPDLPKNFSKERVERAIKEAPSACFLPFAVLNQGARHFSSPPSPLDKRMLSALKSKWAEMMESIWENPQNTLLPDLIHSRARRAISQLLVRICVADPAFQLLAYNDWTIPAMTRIWIASADSESDGMDAPIASMAMRDLVTPPEDPPSEKLNTDHVVKDLEPIPLVYLGANAQDGASLSSQADAIVDAFVKHFKRFELKNDVRLPLEFLSRFLQYNDSHFIQAMSTHESFWQGFFSLVKSLCRSLYDRSTDFKNTTFCIALCLETLSEIALKVPQDEKVDFMLLLIKHDLFDLLDTHIEDFMCMEPRLFVCARLAKFFSLLQGSLRSCDPSFKEAIAQQLPRANLMKSLFSWDLTVAGIGADSSPAQQAMAANTLSKGAAVSWRVIAQIQVACRGRDVCAKRGCRNLGKARCSKCHIGMYCSQDCQKQDWKEHKKVCQVLPLMKLFEAVAL